jgi:hypothetical protein
MAWGRFGFGRLDDDQPIEFWMDDQNGQVAQRDALGAAGRERWGASTRSGENLDASRPTDVVALGGVFGPNAPADATDQDAVAGSAAASDQPGTASSAPSGPPKYVKAQPGDNVTRLLGGGDPAAIGAFARLNGMDDRGSTIYAGRVYRLPTGNAEVTPDDAALGARILHRDNARLAALRAQPGADDQFLARFNAGQNVWTGEPVTASLPTNRPQLAPPLPPSQRQPWWETAAKGGVGMGAYAIGTVVGAPKAVIDAVGDATDAGRFGLDWAGAFGPQAQAQARRAAADAADGALRYVRGAIDDPSRVVSDAREAAGQTIYNMSPLNVDLSGSLGDVAHHQYRHGRNFGEGVTNVAGLFAGGELVQGLRAAEAFEATRAANIAKFVDQGANPKLAEYLAQPYEGMGHHSPVSRKLGKDVDLPPWLVDSPINVSVPRGMSRGDFYEYHYRVDPRAGGFRLPANLNDGKGWRPKELGLTKYNLPQRIWFGTPVPLKDTMAAIPFADGPALYGRLEQPQ